MCIVFVYLIAFNFLSRFAGTGSETVKFLITPQFFFLVSVIAAALILKIKPPEMGLSSKNIVKNMKTGIILSLIPFLAITLFIVLPVLLYQFITPGKVMLLNDFASGRKNYEASFLIQLLILAPFVEELFFRGFLIPPLRKNLPMWATVLIASLVFMLAHGYLKFGAFLLGLGTSLIFLYTGSVIPGIIFHFSCNFWGPVLMFLFPEIYKTIYFLFK